MTPRQFLEQVVLPNITATREADAELRHFYNAVASVDALAAHIYVWCKNNAPSEIQGIANDDGYRAEMGRTREPLKILHDIAKAQKHVELTRPNKGNPPLVTKAADIAERSFGYGEGAFGIGPYGGGPQASVLVNGRKLQIGQALYVAVQTYQAEMDRMGI